MSSPPAPWRSGYAAACKAVYTGSIPVGASEASPAAGPRLARRGPSGAERDREVVERGLLGGTDLCPVLLVALGDAPGERQDELPVLVDLLRARVAFERRDGLLQELHAVALEFVVGVEATVIALGLGGDDLIDQLALAVLLARLAVCLGHRERLAHHPAVVGHRDDHARHRWPREHLVPLRLGEVCLGRHRSPSSQSSGSRPCSAIRRIMPLTGTTIGGPTADRRAVRATPSAAHRVWIGRYRARTAGSPSTSPRPGCGRSS